MAPRSNHVRFVVAALAAIAGYVILSNPASAATSYHYDPGLRGWVHDALEQASYTKTHGKTIPFPVEVRCYTDAYSFDMGAYRRGNNPRLIPSIIAYWAGGNSIHIRAATCAEASAFTRGVYTAETVGAFTTLLHESLHRQGFRDENLTEAFAIAAMRAAGQFAQFNVYLRHGATDNAAAWRAAAPTGDKVLRIAFTQSNRWVAANYRTTWKEVQDAGTIGWAAWLKR
jgi:hypothetical protein